MSGRCFESAFNVRHASHKHTSKVQNTHIQVMSLDINPLETLPLQTFDAARKSYRTSPTRDLNMGFPQTADTSDYPRPRGCVSCVYIIRYTGYTIHAIIL